MSARDLPSLVLLLTLCATSARAGDEPVRVETEHYRLHFDGTQAEADEAARVLEAAWTGFVAFFGAEPPLEKDDKLTVRFLANRERWEQAIRADGTAAPTGAGGYYWPGSKTAYLFRQPTRYFTRVLLIHEAAHQFHFLARTRNKDPGASWYTEGVAEFLSWHAWDGTTLELGVLPAISLKDYAAAALATVQASDFRLSDVVDGSAPASRAIAWSLYRYLATGRDGKPLKRFETFLRKLDGGASAGPAFKSAFGPASKLQKAFAAWLETEQQPWQQVFNEWEGIGRGRMKGHAGVVSACRVKRPTARLTAALEVPDEGRWLGGLLLHHTGRDDYTVALVGSDGSLRVDRRVGGGWKRLANGSGISKSTDGLLHLVARRDGTRVHLQVGGQTYGPWELPGSSFGLALDNAELRFRDVSWE